MFDADLLGSSELAPELGLTKRRVNQLFGELEALGFELNLELNGERKIHRGLAEALKTYREGKRELGEMVADPGLERYRKGYRPFDPTSALLELRGELAVMRGMLGAVWNALDGAGGLRHRIQFEYEGLPNARRGL